MLRPENTKVYNHNTSQPRTFVSYVRTVKDARGKDATKVGLVINLAKLQCFND